MGRLELLKWVALASMLVDHLGKTLFWDLMVPTHFVGRLAVPLFALVLAARLVEGGAGRGLKYVKRLALWGAIAQPAYMWVSGSQVGNFMCSLGLGVLLHEALKLVGRPPVGRGLLAALVAGGALGAGMLVEYGPVGVAMVPLLAALWRRDPLLAAAMCGPMAWVANGSLLSLQAVVNLGAVLASALAAIALTRDIRLPRLNRWFFYAFYPAHLYALYGLAVWSI